MTQATSFHAEDSAFLDTIWARVDGTSEDFQRVEQQIDVLFREDPGKDTNAGLEAYRTELSNRFGPDAPREQTIPSKPYDTAARWLQDGGFDTREDYLWHRDAPTSVRWRLYVNAVPSHAVEIFSALGRSIATTGIDASCKVGSYAIVKSGRDAIVCYAKTAEHRDDMLRALTTYLADKDQYVRPGAVRFTVRAGDGIGYVADPPAPDSITDLVATWLGTPDGQQLHSEGWRFNQSNSQLSFSGVIVNLLASCMLRATSSQTFREHAHRAILTDLGLNPATGELNPTPAVIGWLTHRLFD